MRRCARATYVQGHLRRNLAERRGGERTDGLAWREQPADVHLAQPAARLLHACGAPPDLLGSELVADVPPQKQRWGVELELGATRVDNLAHPGSLGAPEPVRRRAAVAHGNHLEQLGHVRREVERGSDLGLVRGGPGVADRVAGLGQRRELGLPGPRSRRRHQPAELGVFQLEQPVVDREDRLRVHPVVPEPLLHQVVEAVDHRVVVRVQERLERLDEPPGHVPGVRPMM